MIVAGLEKIKKILLEEFHNSEIEENALSPKEEPLDTEKIEETSLTKQKKKEKR